MRMYRDCVVVFSHLRWRFVRQRPQHLLSRCGKERSVYFWEEPLFDVDGDVPALSYERVEDGVTVVVPHLPKTIAQEHIPTALRYGIKELFEEEGIVRPVLWYYTPMALPFTREVEARAVVFDCMDELSLFMGAPPELLELERELLERADVVFTGGHALYEHKRSRHPNIHPFPSSVERAHFARARQPQPDPEDQAGILSPRAGFFGVIDERMDLELITGVATLRPELQIVMLGPVVKIDPATLPQRPNIHWLGGKSYADLPAYLAGWDVAILPFARNESTRFISPTKTPEYLAAGRPVVSTSIRDVVKPYGEQGLVRIADDAPAFSDAILDAIAEDDELRLRRADAFLADLSWDRTWEQMWHLVEASCRAARGGRALAEAAGLHQNREP
jgi:UDP-galactopyranose mutase